MSMGIRLVGITTHFNATIWRWTGHLLNAEFFDVDTANIIGGIFWRAAFDDCAFELTRRTGWRKTAAYR